MYYLVLKGHYSVYETLEVLEVHMIYLGSKKVMSL